MSSTKSTKTRCEDCGKVITGVFQMEKGGVKRCWACAYQTPKPAKATNSRDLDVERAMGCLRGHLNHDELDVLRDIISRMKAGREEYGAMELISDPRDLEWEKYLEYVDSVVYQAMSRIRHRRRQGARK